VNVSTGAAIYFLIWWIVLFAILPFGVRSQTESGEVVAGTDPGAPALPRLVSKLIWTTIVATVVFAICAVIFVNRLVTLDGLGRMFAFPP
jgi:predicted secreted protein